MWVRYWKLMNHLGFDYEDTMGTYVGSLDGITYGKRSVGLLIATALTKRKDVEMGYQDVVHESDE